MNFGDIMLDLLGLVLTFCLIDLMIRGTQFIVRQLEDK